MGLARAFPRLPVLLARIIPYPGLPRADGPGMSDGQRKMILDRLEGSSRAFLAVLENLSDAEWQWSPAPGRWSIAAVAEHVILTERLLLAKVEEALRNPMRPDWKKQTAGKTQFLLRVVAPRRGRARAPKAVAPAGSWSKTDAITKFREARAATVRFAQQTDAEMNARTADHPFAVFGTLSAFQWLLYIPTHLERHLRQIDEIRISSGYPR